MAKVKRGLPEDFDLNITPSPAILGDFLDETEPKAVEVSLSKPIPPKSEVVARVVRTEETLSEKVLPPPRIERHAIPPQASFPKTEGEKFVSFQKATYPKAPRFELSLNHETKRMIQELIAYLQQMGPQPAAKGSELFQGIIGVLYRAKEFLDLSSVPPRGQWGSPTAKAFPVALGQAFAKAIVEQYAAENSKQGTNEVFTPGI